MVLLSHDVVHLRYITIFFISATVRSEKVEVCVFCELADLHCAAAVELVAYGIHAVIQNTFSVAQERYPCQGQ